jgi:transposase-like protein
VPQHRPALDDAHRIADLERKIGQLTMENDFLKKALQHFRDHHPPAVVSGAVACLKKSSKAPGKARP